MIRVVWSDIPAAQRRGRQTDIWLTVAGWMWSAYFIGVVAGVLWLAS